MTDIDSLLEERGKRYGSFRVHAECTQALINVMEEFTPAGKTYTAVQLEALHMIAHKIGRIIAGDADYIDSWDDISGYARLVSQDLAERTPRTEPLTTRSATVNTGGLDD